MEEEVEEYLWKIQHDAFRCCSVNFQAKIAQDWHSLVPVERFIDGKGGRKSLLKDYWLLAHFLSVRLGTASTCWLCVCVRAFYK